MRYVLLIALGFTFAGCATAAWQEGKERWITENPEGMTPAIAQAIREGRVIVGMTPQQASAAWAEWGPAADVNRTVTAGGTTEQWVFRRGGRMRFFYVENGRVTAAQF